MGSQKDLRTMKKEVNYTYIENQGKIQNASQLCHMTVCADFGE